MTPKRVSKPSAVLPTEVQAEVTHARDWLEERGTQRNIDWQLRGPVGIAGSGAGRLALAACRRGSTARRDGVSGDEPARGAQNCLHSSRPSRPVKMRAPRRPTRRSG